MTSTSNNSLDLCVLLWYIVCYQKKGEHSMVKIIKNAIKCKLCGDIIESTYRHDYVECKCGACAVDGGHDYLRRCFKEKDCYIELSESKVILDKNDPQ